MEMEANFPIVDVLPVFFLAYDRSTEDYFYEVAD